MQQRRRRLQLTGWPSWQSTWPASRSLVCERAISLSFSASWPSASFSLFIIKFIIMRMNNVDPQGQSVRQPASVREPKLRVGLANQLASAGSQSRRARCGQQKGMKKGSLYYLRAFRRHQNQSQSQPRRRRCSLRRRRRRRWASAQSPMPVIISPVWQPYGWTVQSRERSKVPRQHPASCQHNNLNRPSGLGGCWRCCAERLDGWTSDGRARA